MTIMVSMALMTEAGAQNIESVLEQIEANNKEIQAQKEQAIADKMQVQTQNNLEDPSIEYSPFFDKKSDGVVSSELVVKQGFDFPTLYVARKKSGTLQKETIDRRTDGVRRDILLNAKTLCLDLIHLNKVSVLLQERKKNADHLLALFEKRLTEGDANIIEVNKIKMERMSVQTEIANNVSAHRKALQQLIAMNGNRPMSLEMVDYPAVEEVRDYNMLYDEVMSTDATLLEAEAAARSAANLIAVNRQQWLPKLEVAYRRNTSMNEANNGFLVGGSIPVFSNRKKVKIARAQAVSAQLLLDNARMQAEANVMSQFNETVQLRDAMKVYDVSLMNNTLHMLQRAVEVGQLSIIDYYVEADNVYRNLLSYMNIENQYQRLMAEIYKNRL